MKSVNKVIIIGNLTRDPETVQINQNAEVSKFTVAVNDSYKKPTGENVDITTYIDCEAWAGLSGVVSKYLRKGSKVYIEGNLRADTWVDADTGKNRTKHKIKVLEMLMLDGKRDGGEGESSNYSENTSANTSEKPPVNSVDSELPF